MQVRLHGSRGGVFGGHRPPRDPGGPLHYFRIILELERERTKEEKEREEVLHLFRCYTHTPGRSQVNPERQKEEKSGHTKGKRPRTAQGGEGNRRTSGTNLHGETDLNKTAHTPKPHDTLRRGTRGELGTKWGLVDETQKPKQVIKNQDSVPKPRSRALCHSRPVVNSCPNWHKTAIRVPAN